METNTKKLSDTKIEVSFKVNKDEFEKCVEEVLRNIQKDFEYPGFRKGQVPLDIIKKNVSDNFLLEKTAGVCVRKYYYYFLINEKVKAIGEPKIEILKLAFGDDFEFKVQTDVLPEIQLPDYKKIASEFKKEKVEVKDSDVQETIDWVLKSRAKIVAKNIESAAEKGDYVEISLKMENQEESKDAFILGEGRLIGDMEKQIEGMKFCEEKEMEVTFPENHFRKDLAGRKMKIKVKVEGIFNLEIPELSDSFVKTLGNFQNVEDFKKSIREGIQKEKEIDASNKLRSQILDRIIENTNFEIPQILIDREVQRIKNDFQKTLEQNNMSLEDYLKKFNKTKEQIEKEILDMAKKTIKNYLVLSEIADKENIQASQEEIQKEIESILSKYASVEQAKKDFDEQTLISFAKDRVLQEKVLIFLESLAKDAE
ncbi:Trigger factor [bacterium HR34]|nr:Trigger factor [bacterium HR34]